MMYATWNDRPPYMNRWYPGTYRAWLLWYLGWMQLLIRYYPLAMWPTLPGGMQQ